MSDIEYVLPKVYNGKTVEELFPEFKHNSILRFSKLFGPGRVTSLPKIWRGVKKRRKLTDQKNDENIENNGDTSRQQQQRFNKEMSIDESSQDEYAYVVTEKEFKIDFGRLALNEELAQDDELKLLQPYQITEEQPHQQQQTKSNSNQQQKDSDLTKNANWRYGPASYWYTNNNTNQDDHFEYGFKAKTTSDGVTTVDDNLNDGDTFSLSIAVNENDVPSESYLLVNTLNWEDRIIYDNTVMRDKVDLASERIKYAGWIPSAEHRTISSFQSKVFGKNVEFLNRKEEESTLLLTKPSIKWCSIFPNENYELIYGDWEKNIIFDPENMETIPTPPEFILDSNDDNLILSIPDEPLDVDDGKTKEAASETNAKKKKHELYENRNKISKSLLGRSGILKEDVHEEKEETNRDAKDFWNLSNDDYYSTKVVADAAAAAAGTTTTKSSASALVLQHSIVALELRPPFFPTHIGIAKLRNFHRLPLKKYPNGPLVDSNKFHHVTSLYKEIARKAQQLEKERLAYTAAGCGEMSYIRNASDLTGMDGQLILAEYSEQYPPLMMQIGMATKIKNYYKRKLGKDDGPPALEYGENVLAHNSSPFLGTLKAGDCLQSFENYLFRSPIYLHEVPSSDFLIIRTRQGYFIRDIKDIFTVGQQCPLVEVPGPNSKRANLFIKDFLQVHIFRLFHRSKDKPKRLKMEDIRKAFPTYAESGIRKRLKLCADFKRTGLAKYSGSDANWWVLKDNMRLPTEEEIRQMITPEQCCAYYSMLAAEQRLKDAGYGEKNLFAADDEDVDNIKIDDEVKNAPWHTTRAYLDATKGKCFLQVTGVADPTGRGEGFSYVRQAFKPTSKDEEEKQQKEKEQQQKEQKEQSKRMVTGTDADLRRLHLADAKKLLLKYGLPQEEIDKLKRWTIIDVVRTMSTQKAKEGSETTFSKFARGNRIAQSDAHEKFREECQRIFELQNRSLASHEVLSTDDDEDSNEDTDVDEMGKNLESMLQSKKAGDQNSNETSNEKELKQLIMPNRLLNTNTDSNSSEKQAENSLDGGLKSSKLFDSSTKQNRILKITRTYRSEDGVTYTEVETVKKPLIIDAYLRIRTTKDDEYIRQAFALDEEEREHLRKEKRRLQEQLRRVKRNEAARRINESKDDADSETQNEGEVSTVITIKPPKKKYKKSELQTSLDDSGMNTSAQPIKTVKCGACGTIGHSKSNRECPLFTPKENINASHDDTNDNENSQTSGFTKLQGTKIIIDKRVMSTQSSSKQPKVPRKYNKQKAQAGGDQSNDDASLNISKEGDDSSSSSSPLKKKLILTIPKDKLSKPKVVKPLKLHKLKQQLEKQSLKLKQPSTPQPQQQQQPIPKKVIQLNQQSAVNSPIMMQQGDTQLFSFQQQLLQQQFSLQQQMARQESSLSKQQQQQRRKNTSQVHCDYLDKPQKKVDRRHIDPLVSFATILENILNEVRDLPESQPFLLPVNAKKVIDYYTVIKDPIDLQTIRKKIQDKGYTNQESFLDDMKLLVSNSELYNGTNHLITNQAHSLYGQCVKRLNEQKDKLTRLEKAINPLLDDNSLIRFKYLLEKIFDEQIMGIENSYAFHKPVNKAKYKDYYDVIKNPIDLESIKNKIVTKKYKAREQFLGDFSLLLNNCLKYNGPNHSLTATAEKIYNTCKAAVEANDQLGPLEEAIEANFLIGDAMRSSIDMTDSESNLAPLSTLHDNEPGTSSHLHSNSSINYHEEHVITNISTKTKSAISNSSVWSAEKLQLNMSPQSIPTSEQDVYVDVESLDDKNALMDDLQISEDDEED